MRVHEFRLLVVEDNEQELQTCRESVERYEHETHRKFSLVECRTLDDALLRIDNTFDGAIVDLKLDEGGAEGNKVIEAIQEKHLRIPVAILTGTPSDATDEPVYVGTFKKGEQNASYSSLLERFWDIHKTGLTRIVGGRGKIEEALDRVFHECLKPRNEAWIEYGRGDSDRTEKALLRLVVSHLMQLLDDDEDGYFPEEFYLAPPLANKTTTGTILIRRSDSRYFIVLSPACDLVTRDDGRCNTDHILLAGVDDQATVLPGMNTNGSLSKGKKKQLKSAYQNRKGNHYHWLPPAGTFPSGFINFRKLLALTEEEIREGYSEAGMQVAAFFVKNIVARFSTYYARQGQPDVDVERILSAL